MQWVTMVNVITMNITMFTFLITKSYGFGCRCFGLVGALLLMLGCWQVQHIIPWPYFAKTDGKGQNWSPFWPPLTFPLQVTIDSSFLESFWVVMVITNLPPSTTQNPQSSFSTMWNASSNVARFSWVMMSWGLTILCTFLPYMDKYNCTNCYSMKTSLFSLINHANPMYGVSSFSFWTSWIFCIWSPQMPPYFNLKTWKNCSNGSKGFPLGLGILKKTKK